MLIKLVKHEMKVLSRYLFPLYIITFVLMLSYGIIFSLLINKNNYSEYINQLINSISAIIFIAMIIAINAVTIIITALRIYRNLLGSEGYLMNTIPVTTNQNLISKTLSSLIWNIIASIVSILIFLVVAKEDLLEGSLLNIMKPIIAANDALGCEFYQYCIELFICFILSQISGILIIYGSVCIGHLFTRRILGSVLGFIILKCFFSGIVLLIEFFIKIEPATESNVTSIQDFAGNSFIHGVLWGASVQYIFVSICCYFLCKYILSKKLNLF